MLLLHVLGYGAAAAAILFVTLSLASGLLWLSEIIEEHSRTSKVVGIRATYAIMVLHVLLWLFDSLPFTYIAFSILCHVIYLTNFTSHWPTISLSSYSFIGSCIAVLSDHFIWFTYFSHRTRNARQSMRKFGSADWRPLTGSEAKILTFMDIATFFGVCVWLIPLFLFLSLSANDNALPFSSRKSLLYCGLHDTFISHSTRNR
ncbi:DUF396-domain-containing protein [Clavulina sp. PMI_390]|nr:DUF396-domain-containing protein [Clavulina sp. PMI_390]